MIQSAMEEVTLKKTHWLSPIDLVDLAESFIYDSDTKSCHRDVEYGARQLQQTDQSCNNLGCFDCAATVGACMWNPEIKVCLKPNQSINGLRWWQWFEYCEDDLGFCTSNGKKYSELDEGSLKKQIDNDQEVQFAIQRAAGYLNIPENYFCKWEITIDKASEYNLSIKRSFNPIKEQLELNIIGDNKQ